MQFHFYFEDDRLISGLSPLTVNTWPDSGFAAILNVGDWWLQCCGFARLSPQIFPALFGVLRSILPQVTRRTFVQDVCGRAEETVPQSQSGMEAPDVARS